mmetsp:Transcript_32992/g.74445  ORF Transcript_32992/g.74445 Transcript_32992/m.74445 type:complete len:214 (+) Transcript_32992:1101-1742(+)
MEVIRVALNVLGVARYELLPDLPQRPGHLGGGRQRGKQRVRVLEGEHVEGERVVHRGEHLHPREVPEGPGATVDADPGVQLGELGRQESRGVAREVEKGDLEVARLGALGLEHDAPPVRLAGQIHMTELARVRVELRREGPHVRKLGRVAHPAKVTRGHVCCEPRDESLSHRGLRFRETPDKSRPSRVFQHEIVRWYPALLGIAKQGRFCRTI